MRKNIVLLCCIVLLTGCSCSTATVTDDTTTEEVESTVQEETSNELPSDETEESTAETEGKIEELESKIAELESIIEDLTTTEEESGASNTFYSLEDGIWQSGQSNEWENSPYFTDAYIENNKLYIIGRLGKFDYIHGDTVLSAERFELDLSEGCEILASGGVAEDMVVDKGYFNNCFHTSFTGLGLTVVSEDGLIIKILICS